MDAHGTPPPKPVWPTWRRGILEEAEAWLLVVQLYRRRVAPRQIPLGFSDQDIERVLGKEPKVLRAPIDPRASPSDTRGMGQRPQPSTPSKEAIQEYEEEVRLAEKSERENGAYRRDRANLLKDRWDLSWAPDYQPFSTVPYNDRNWKSKTQVIAYDLPDYVTGQKIPRLKPKAIHPVHQTCFPESLLLWVPGEDLMAFLQESRELVVLSPLSWSPETEEMTQTPGPPLGFAAPLMDVLVTMPFVGSLPAPDPGPSEENPAWEMLQLVHQAYSAATLASGAIRFWEPILSQRGPSSGGGTGSGTTPAL